MTRRCDDSSCSDSEGPAPYVVNDDDYGSSFEEEGPDEPLFPDETTADPSSAPGLYPVAYQPETSPSPSQDLGPWGGPPTNDVYYLPELPARSAGRRRVLRRRKKLSKREKRALKRQRLGEQTVISFDRNNSSLVVVRSTPFLSTLLGVLGLHA